MSEGYDVPPMPEFRHGKFMVPPGPKAYRSWWRHTAALFTRRYWRYRKVSFWPGLPTGKGMR